MRRAKLIDAAGLLAVILFYLALGVLAWIGLFGGDAGLAWPATMVLVGSLVFACLTFAIANDLREKDWRKR